MQDGTKYIWDIAQKLISVSGPLYMMKKMIWEISQNFYWLNYVKRFKQCVKEKKIWIF